MLFQKEKNCCSQSSKAFSFSSVTYKDYLFTSNELITLKLQEVMTHLLAFVSVLFALASTVSSLRNGYKLKSQGFWFKKARLSLAMWKDKVLNNRRLKLEAGEKWFSNLWILSDNASKSLLEQHSAIKLVFGPAWQAIVGKCTNGPFHAGCIRHDRNVADPICIR